ncbi:MAG: hypothetical protein WC208_14370, partial [Gallionella sp.]
MIQYLNHSFYNSLIPHIPSFPSRPNFKEDQVLSLEITTILGIQTFTVSGNHLICSSTLLHHNPPTQSSYTLTYLHNIVHLERGKYTLRVITEDGWYYFLGEELTNIDGRLNEASVVLEELKESDLLTDLAGIKETTAI